MRLPNSIMFVIISVLVITEQWSANNIVEEIVQVPVPTITVICYVFRHVCNTTVQ